MDNESTVTNEYYADQYGSVYDENGFFYCETIVLSENEKKIINSNPFSIKIK